MKKIDIFHMSLRILHPATVTTDIVWAWANYKEYHNYYIDVIRLVNL